MTGSDRPGEGGPRLDAAGPPAATAGEGCFRIALKRRAEFQRAAKGRRLNAKSLTLQVLRRPDEPSDEPRGPSRFGLTVTKRVGNAVERNRIKRRFRAVLRGPGVAARPGHDYVIVARRDALTLPFTSLVAELAKTLDQARAGRSPSRRGASAGKTVKPEPSA